MENPKQDNPQPHLVQAEPPWDDYPINAAGALVPGDRVLFCESPMAPGGRRRVAGFRWIEAEVKMMSLSSKKTQCTVFMQVVRQGGSRQIGAARSARSDGLIVRSARSLYRVGVVRKPWEDHGDSEWHREARLDMLANSIGEDGEDGRMGPPRPGTRGGGSLQPSASPAVQAPPPRPSTVRPSSGAGR